MTLRHLLRLELARVVGTRIIDAAHPVLPQQAFYLTPYDGGPRLVLPFAPIPTSHSGFGWDWETVERAGRTPLLMRSTKRLAGLSFTLVVGYADYQKPVDALLLELERLDNNAARLAIGYSRPEQGVWQIVDMTYDVTARQMVTNVPTRASVQMSFTRVSDPPGLIGPPRKSTAQAAVGPAITSRRLTGRTYRRRGGESLYAVAARFYGDGDVWTIIADLNGITDPRSLADGMLLRLP